MRRIAVVLLLVTILVGVIGVGRLPARGAPAGTILDHILQSWTTLERSNRNLLEAARDPKLGARERWPVYISRQESLARVRSELQDLVPPEELARIDLRVLPEDVAHLEVQGLLYLPHPYVVPGGRYNEMYGWDSYFIILGLLRDGRADRARDMVDNFLYEVQHYGHILNANRTYYLSRSQPPFLTHMVLAVYEKTGDRAWLEATLPTLQKDYDFWTTGPHQVPETGLSRYWDFGEGPSVEVLEGECDERGRTHYDRVQEFLRTRPVADYDVSRYYDRKQDRLTPLFYKADRAMRESGFNPSNRFGACNLDVLHHNPADLNTLLWMAEHNTARILEILGRTAEVRTWLDRADARRNLIFRYNWDPGTGLFLDYNFQTGERRNYPFATTFFPLWAGLATPEQAARVAGNLALFECPGGLATSTVVSGQGWDRPFGWPPLQMVAVEGLRKYGFAADADRVSFKFLSLILQEFEIRGTIVQKYNVVDRTIRSPEELEYGFSNYEVGFGWTNAVYTRLYDRLPEARRAILNR